MVPGWIKALFVMVLLTIGVFVVILLLPTCKKKPEPEKTFYDIAAQDDARLRAEPVVKEPNQAAQLQAKPKFKELAEDEQIEAERLLEWAIQTRKMGRLPAVSYQQTVDACRGIIKKFPGSEYEFKAKRILADIPEQYRKEYKITDEEINLGNLK
jgi:hypothetical protein